VHYSTNKNIQNTINNIHTHNRFMALFDYVQDYLGDLAPQN